MGLSYCHMYDGARSIEPSNYINKNRKELPPLETKARTSEAAVQISCTRTLEHLYQRVVCLPPSIQKQLQHPS